MQSIEPNNGNHNKPRRVLIVAGGTGGHIAPALAVGDALRDIYRDRVQVRYLTGSKQIEKHAFAAAEEFPDTISCDAAPRLSLSAIPQLLRYAASLRESVAFLRKYRPSVVLATGGYVCAPVLQAAKWLKIPYYLHESNAVPGRVTRLFAQRAANVFLAHDSAKTRLGIGNCRNIGTPVRQSIIDCTREDGLAHFGFSRNKPTLLVIGGSQGAHAINETILDALPLLAGQFTSGLQVIWACGPLNHKTIAAKLGELTLQSIDMRLFDFLDRMDCAYAAADLVISRAGASSIAEIVALGLPSILVPYPHAKDNHQQENAATLCNAGAAVLLDEKEMNGASTAALVANLLLSVERRQAMARASREVGSPDCSRMIANILMDEPIEHAPAAVTIQLPEQKLTA